jgi:hypothetical protein
LIEYTPTHAVGVVVSTDAMLGLGSQASLAVGGVNTGLAGQLIGVFAPAALKLGAVIS